MAVAVYPRHNKTITIFNVNGTDKEITLFNRSDLLSTSDITNKGYVADARLSYKNEGDGTEAAPYNISQPRQLALLAEAAYLSVNYKDFGYEYVENTGADADGVPLILKPVQ